MKRKDLRQERERQRREEYKKVILSAAETVITRQGFSATTMDDIAEEAQFSKATLYRYFKGKGELIFEIIANYLEEMNLRLKKIREKKKSVKEKLKEVISYALHLHAEKENISRVFIMDKSFLKWMRIFITDQDRLVSDMDKKFVQMIKSKYREIFENASELLAEGVASGDFRKMDIPAIVTFLDALIEGYFHGKFWSEKKRDLEADIHLMNNFILNGIEKKAGSRKGESI